jgi:hypothetical protein
LAPIVSSYRVGVLFTRTVVHDLLVAVAEDEARAVSSMVQGGGKRRSDVITPQIVANRHTARDNEQLGGGH